MPRRTKDLLFWRWAVRICCGVVLAGGVSGCAMFRGGRTVEAPPPGDALAASHAATSAPAGGFKLDMATVLSEQHEELREQAAVDEGALIAPGEGFTRKMDRWHERSYLWMDNAVRSVDTRWLTPDTRYETELSTFQLALLARLGGRGDDGSFDFKVKFDADLALPGLENKLHLFIDNAGRTALPGEDPMQQEDNPRAGFRATWKSLTGGDASADVGARWSGGPVAFGEVGCRWAKDLGGGSLWFHPVGFYYSDDGFGEKATLGWRKSVTEHRIWQFISAERCTEQTDGFELEETVRLALLRSGTGRGWLFQASLFPQIKHSSMYLDNSLLSVSWRDALYRKWIYYTLTPQVEFAEEDGHDPHFSFRVAVDILFGGHIDSLM